MHTTLHCVDTQKSGFDAAASGIESEGLERGGDGFALAKPGGGRVTAGDEALHSVHLAGSAECAICGQLWLPGQSPHCDCMTPMTAEEKEELRRMLEHTAERLRNMTIKPEDLIL